MKNKQQEFIYRYMRQYHRHHQWGLENGLLIPHAYPHPTDKLSWWDDVGFILNGRRIMVWWVHPRMKYADAITDAAWKEAGDSLQDGTDIFDFGQSEKIWKKVGHSRKKISSYQIPSMSDVQNDYYTKLSNIKTRIKTEGIDLVVRPSMSVEALSWCRGVSLCIPIEVRDRNEIIVLATLARRLLKGETSIANEFTGYQYGREDWQSEAELRNHGIQKDESLRRLY